MKPVKKEEYAAKAIIRNCRFPQLIALTSFVLSTSVFAESYNDYTMSDSDNIRDVTLSVNDTIIDQKLSGDGIDALRFTRKGNTIYSVKLRSAGGNTLPGGVIADGFLLKIQNPNVLGTGPVLLKNQWSGLYVDWQGAGSSVDVHNRVVFDTIDSYAAGENAYKLILHNVGVTGNNTAKAVSLGREKTGTANVTLALDGDQNDAVGYFNLRGNLALTLDGGTLRAAATGGERDLFQKVNDQATPSLAIENSPLTIDVAEGGTVGFGVSPTYKKDKTSLTLVEEYKPDNWSFEDGNTGWTFSNGSTYTRGAAFDANGTWGPKDGDKYAMVRNGATLTREIEIPTDGLWCVVFDMGCRNENYSLNIGTTVTIDTASVLTIAKLTDESQTHGFEEVRSEPHTLTAGKHDFKIELSSTGGYGSLNFDAIRFERYEESVPGHSIVKTGTGTLSLKDGDLPSDGANVSVMVGGGTVFVTDTALKGNSFSVAGGAALSFSGVTADGTEVSVAAGGTAILGALGENIVNNGGFEKPEVADYGFQWASACDWTLEPTAEPRPAIQHNGGTLTKSADQTPYGSQSLFLRTGTSASQTVYAPASGDYVLSFWQAPRNYASSNELALKVVIDGVEVVENKGQSVRYEPYRTSKAIQLAQGAHTVKIECLDGGGSGSGIFVDDVSLAAVMPLNDFSKASLSLKPGATLRVDGAENAKTAIGTVVVDGVAVRGGADALRAAGVIVEGTGRIQCGAPFGLTVIVR